MSALNPPPLVEYFDKDAGLAYEDLRAILATAEGKRFILSFAAKYGFGNFGLKTQFNAQDYKTLAQYNVAADLARLACVVRPDLFGGVFQAHLDLIDELEARRKNPDD